MKKAYLLFVSLFFSVAIFCQVNLNQGLMAYYPFSGNANDVSGNNNNPIFNNATLTADRFGNPNSAYSFNGTSSYMQIPNNATLNFGTQMSVTAWVKVAGFYQGPCHGNRIVMKGDGEGLTGSYLLTYDDNGFTNGQNCSIPAPDIQHENFYGINTPPPNGGYSPFVQTNQWYMITYTSDGTTAKFYVNCQLKLSAPANGYTYSNSYDLFFGKMNYPNFPYWFNGVLDEVRIYNRALNQQEVNVLAAGNLNFDFTYQINTCNPLSVQFKAAGTDTLNTYWSFGDGGTATGTTNPLHLYPAQGNYVVKYSVSNGTCPDTVTKTINVSVINADIILTHDTSICSGTSKQLLTAPSLGFCWSPTTYLNNPNSPNPITTPLQNITYYYTAEITGNNIITNGDFNSGNTGFVSQYTYTNPNTTEGQYFVGPNPQAWNPNLSNCTDHTGANGNMMLVNGASTPDVKVWSQTVIVTPNTNYAFSTWIQSLASSNPAQLKFSINGRDIGSPVIASLPTCNWSQFYTSWNSGSLTIANLAIVNKNTQPLGNDYALDDISFAPLLLKRDSVTITLIPPVTPSVTISTVLNNICKGTSVTFTAIAVNGGAAPSFQWFKNGNPVGTNSSSYTDATLNNGDIIKCRLTSSMNCATPATVESNSIIMAVTNPPANIRYTTLSATANQPIQLQARNLAGGTYNWQPTAGLNNPLIINPIFSYGQTQEYRIYISIPPGCQVVDTQLVKINSKKGIFVPKAFSPNGDGTNDRLYPILLGIQQLNYFRIYNRWGNLIFETNSGNPASGWDGKYKGSLQPVETYTWVAEAIDIDGIVIKKSGNTVLLR